MQTKTLLRKVEPPIIHEVLHFPRKRLIDFLIMRENPNGKYFIPLSFEQMPVEGFIPLHQVYIDRGILKSKLSISLEEVRNRCCTLVTNYAGVIQEDLVPHLYDFLASKNEVDRIITPRYPGEN